MPDQDVLGPGAAGAPRALPSSDPSITATINFPDASDTWFQDCVNNTAGTGTPYVAEWANRQLQMIRRVIRNSGIPLTYADDQLAYGIQQGLQWVGTFGGTANALTATMVPAPMLLVPGTEIKGLIGATNTGPVTLNTNGLGTLPVMKVDGTALAGAEMVIGGVASFIYTGSGYVLLGQSLLGFQKILLTNTTFWLDRLIGSDTLYDGSSATISGSQGPWATLAHAAKVLATYNLNGNTVTIQLGATGTYFGVIPNGISAPGNGALKILGNASAQSTYTISGSPGSGDAVLNIQSGIVNLVGLTVGITGSNAGANGVSSSLSSVSMQNVSITSASGAVQSLAQASNGGNLNFVAGNIMAGSAQSMWRVQNGGSITMSANVALSGTPAFSTATMYAVNLGIFDVLTSGLSFTGSGATGQKYLSTANSVINTLGGGSGFFPGGVAGGASSGGVYL